MAISSDNNSAIPAPVIRQVEVSTEPIGSRVLNRHIPAWVVSGAIHVAVIGALVVFMSGPVPTAANPNDLTITHVDGPNDDDHNLTEQDLGFDPTLKAAVDAETEDRFNLIAPKSDEPLGLPNESTDTASDAGRAGLTQDQAEGGTPADRAIDGLLPPGAGGMGHITQPGLRGRNPATRDKLLRDRGGNSESEAAVAAGLAWLARKQLKDGSWEFDGTSKDKIAATGLALLPFLAAGETHKFGTKYKDTVRRGLELADEPDRFRRRLQRHQQHVLARHRHGGAVRGRWHDQGPEREGQGDDGRRLHRQRPGPQR